MQLVKMLCFVFKRVDAQRQANNNMTSFVVQYCCMMASTLQEWREEFQKAFSCGLMVCIYGFEILSPFTLVQSD
jgi:hypothetical protein